MGIATPTIPSFFFSPFLFDEGFQTHTCSGSEIIVASILWQKKLILCFPNALNKRHGSLCWNRFEVFCGFRENFLEKLFDGLLTRRTGRGESGEGEGGCARVRELTRGSCHGSKRCREEEEEEEEEEEGS
jgi:hypothetical protein